MIKKDFLHTADLDNKFDLSRFQILISDFEKSLACLRDELHRKVDSLPEPVSGISIEFTQDKDGEHTELKWNSRILYVDDLTVSQATPSWVAFLQESNAGWAASLRRYLLRNTRF